MEIKEYQAVIEAVLFASGEPVSVDRLAEILELDKPTVLKLAQSLQERLEQKDSGVCLLRIDNQFQMASKPEYGEYYPQGDGYAPECAVVPGGDGGAFYCSL